MAGRNEHLVVIMLAPLSKGEEFEVWEPHITIVPWFPVDDESRLDGVLSAVAGRHSPLKAEAGEIEVWGRKDKYEIQKFNDDDKLRELHRDVFTSLEANGFPIHQKDFMGEKYTPHIALRNRLQKGEALKEGRVIDINSFSLVRQNRLKKSGRMIKSLVREYELG